MIDKVSRLMQEFLGQNDDGFGPPSLRLAYRFSGLQDHIRESVFDFCIAFIREVADGDAYSPMMRRNKETAQRITDML